MYNDCLYPHFTATLFLSSIKNILYYFHQNINRLLYSPSQNDEIIKYLLIFDFLLINKVIINGFIQIKQQVIDSQNLRLSSMKGIDSSQILKIQNVKIIRIITSLVLLLNLDKISTLTQVMFKFHSFSLYSLTLQSYLLISLYTKRGRTKSFGKRINRGLSQCKTHSVNSQRLCLKLPVIANFLMLYNLKLQSGSNGQK